MTRLTTVKFVLLAAVSALIISINGCGGGGSTADRGNLSADSYQDLALNSPSGSTAMTAAQAAANATIIS
jgi:hypothetical protein